MRLLLLVFLLGCETIAPMPDEPVMDNDSRVNVRETIIIDKPGTYDFGRVLHRWRGEGKCNQDEGQPPILSIRANNVHVKNFYWENAPDGVHVRAPKRGQRIRNVILENFRGHACEDALTLRFGDGIQLIDSVLWQNPNENFRDKTIQLDSSINTLLDNVVFVGGERCIRFKSGADFTVTNSQFLGCKHPMLGDTTDDNPHYDRPGKPATARSLNNKFYNCGNHAFNALDDKVIYESVNDTFASCKHGVNR